MGSKLILRRELVAQARHASNYWLRVCGGLLVSIVFAALALEQDEPATAFGVRLAMAGVVHGATPIFCLLDWASTGGAYLRVPRFPDAPR